MVCMCVMKRNRDAAAIKKRNLHDLSGLKRNISAKGAACI